MKLDLDYSYPADVEKVFALISDQAFRLESCLRTGAVEADVTVEETADGVAVRIQRTMPAEVPDFIKKLTGENVTVLQIEQWSAPAADGSRTADVTVEVKGQPAGMKGTAAVAPSGDSSSFTVNGDVKVSIPLIGKRIEPEIAKAIEDSITADVEYGTTKL